MNEPVKRQGDLWRPPGLSDRDWAALTCYQPLSELKVGAR